MHSPEARRGVLNSDQHMDREAQRESVANAHFAVTALRRFDGAPVELTTAVVCR